MVSSYLTRVNAKTREAASVILSQNAVFYPRIYTCAILDGLKEVRGFRIGGGEGAQQFRTVVISRLGRTHLAFGVRDHSVSYGQVPPFFLHGIKAINTSFFPPRDSYIG